MLTFRLLLLSLIFLFPAARLDTDPCPRGTPIATPAPGETLDDLCPATPTPAGSSVNLPVVSTGNDLRPGDDAQSNRNNYLIAAGVTTIVLGVAGFLLFRRPGKKGNS
jgi:hypothetical protein